MPPATHDQRAARTGKADRAAARRAASNTSQLRALRVARGMTQQELADASEMHRNSIRNIEKGRTKEISAEHASALCAALGAHPHELGVYVRAETKPRPSLRLRQLTIEQRMIVQEILALPPEDFAVLRSALTALRRR
jgi:transcriptional regulator with XRE-family HTH domain